LQTIKETVMRNLGSVAGVVSIVALASLGDARQRTPGAPDTVMSISVQSGRLSASIANAPLPAVLDELRRRTGIAITVGDGLDLGYVAAELKSVAIEEGIRELLKNYDAFFYYTPRNGRPASLAAVWVYPRGAAAALQPIPPEIWASTADLEAALRDTDPGIRERAYDTLMARPDRASRSLVVLAIQGASETDVELRERLLSAAMTKGIAVPRDVLADLVRADSAETIRLLALDALSGDSTAREVGVAALADASTLVRERAREFLAELDALDRRDPSIR
jgi:hypothetical protein